MSGLRLIRAASFDPEATRAMGLAYEQACAGVDGNNAAACELVAKRIIEAAKRGERDVTSLAKYGLAGLQGLPGSADAS
jgi:hypothetical protein